MNEDGSELENGQQPMVGAPSPERPRKGIWQNAVARTVIIVLIALGAGFLAGWIPGRRTAQQHTQTVQRLQRDMVLGQLQNTLASAAIDARRGEYEVARQGVSRFFTELRAEVDRGPDSVLASVPRENLEPLFAQRDQMITLLARSDPASAERLSDLHLAFRKVVAPGGGTDDLGQSK